MTRITQVREGNALFDLIEPDQTPEIFADGVSHAMIGYPMSKIVLHSVIAPANGDGAVEQRRAILRLTIGTDVLTELCRNILNVVLSESQTLDSAIAAFQERIRKAGESVTISSPQEYESDAKP